MESKNCIICGKELGKQSLLRLLVPAYPVDGQTCDDCDDIARGRKTYKWKK